MHYYKIKARQMVKHNFAFWSDRDVMHQCPEVQHKTWDKHVLLYQTMLTYMRHMLNTIFTLYQRRVIRRKTNPAFCSAPLA